MASLSLAAAARGGGGGGGGGGGALAFIHPAIPVICLANIPTATRTVIPATAPPRSPRWVKYDPAVIARDMTIAQVLDHGHGPDEMGASGGVCHLAD